MAYVMKIKYENNLRRCTLQKSEIESDSFSLAHLETRIRELFQLPATSVLAVTYTDEENDVVTMGNDQDLKDALIEQQLNPLRIHVTLSKPKSGGDKAEPGKAVVPDNADVVLKRLLRTLSQTPETVKHAFQAYEPLFEGVKSPSQIPGLVENFLQTIASQVTAGVKNGSAAAAAASPFGAHPPPPPPPQFGPCVFPPHPDKFPGPQFGESGPSAVSEGADSGNQASQVVHHGVACDECGVSPIVGNRWKSTVKFDFDLCSECYEKVGNDKEYAKIEQPKFRPRHMHGPRRMGHPFHPMGPPPPFGPMDRPPFHTMGPHGYIHGGKPFGMRGPFGGFGGRHHCGSFGDKLYARFVCDVTVFDGTEVAPGTQFVKIWRLRNSGAAPWPVNTTLVFVGGDELGPVVSVPLEIPQQGLDPEAEMEASVDMVAPEKPGRYVSHWRLASPAGPKFGQRLSVVIQVVPKSTLDNPAELVSVGDDAPAQEVESGGGSTSQTPAKVEQEGPLTMLSFGDFGDNSGVLDVAEAEKEQLVQKDVPSAAQSSELGGGLSLVGDVAINTAEESTGMTEVEDKATEKVVPDPAEELGIDVDDEMVVEPTILEASPASEGRVTYPAVEGTQDLGPITYPVVDIAVAAEAAEPAEGEDLSTARALVSKLEAMGFTDSKLNYELLEKNGFDLRKTLDDLCAAEEWDPILEELEEMGFYDTVVNRRLMFKNNGSVKRVVKELVQMYRDIQGKREKVE